MYRLVHCFSMQFSIYVFFIQQIVLYTQCGVAIAKALIGVNVRKATRNEFLSVVSLKYINADNPTPETDHECTGILISKRDVLTAAHCFSSHTLRDFEIIVGTNDLWRGRKFDPLWGINYNQWARKNKFKRQYYENDIAIIRLTRDVPESIYPIIISTMPSDSFYGTTAVTAGWGKGITGETPRLMETVEVTILSNAECERRVEEEHGSKVDIDERYLCTIADPPAVLGSGDSGGPLLCMGVLIGINKSTCPYPDVEYHPKKVNMHFSMYFYQNFIFDVKNNYN